MHIISLIKDVKDRKKMTCSGGPWLKVEIRAGHTLDNSALNGATTITTPAVCYVRKLFCVKRMSPSCFAGIWSCFWGTGQPSTLDVAVARQ